MLNCSKGPAILHRAAPRGAAFVAIRGAARFTRCHTSARGAAR